jgi:hypothetical protein
MKEDYTDNGRNKEISETNEYGVLIFRWKLPKYVTVSPIGPYSKTDLKFG